MRRYLLLITPLLLLLSACATAPPAGPTETPVPGKVLETLRSEISLTATTLDGSTGGSGFLLYRRPADVRMVLLSPLGFTMAEAFASGDRLTFVIPSRQTAYAGRFEEIPGEGGLRTWRMLRAGMGVPPYSPDDAGRTRERAGSDGTETLRYDGRGFLAERRTGAGDLVSYREYAVVGGVPIPGVIEFRDPAGTGAVVKIREPEVNVPLEDEVFRPELDGVTVLPFSAFRGN